MKYITFTFCLLFGTGLIGQGFYIDAGVKAQYGGTSLINSAILDRTDWTYDIATGYSFGGKLGFNFEDHGITVDAMFGKYSASFESNNGADNTFTDWQFTDIYLLYRLSRFRGYFEVGPKVSFIKDVENTYPDGTIENTTEFYNDNAFSGVLGFGTYIIGSDGSFSGIFGLRFEYGLSDMLDESLGAENGYPINQPDLYTAGYETTHNFFAGLVFELNWGIGYYGKASCGARGKFIFL